MVYESIFENKSLFGLPVLHCMRCQDKKFGKMPKIRHIKLVGESKLLGHHLVIAINAIQFLEDVHEFFAKCRIMVDAEISVAGIYIFGLRKFQIYFV